MHLCLPQHLHPSVSNKRIHQQSQQLQTKLGEQVENQLRQQTEHLQPNIFQGQKDAKLLHKDNSLQIDDMQQQNYLEISSQVNSNAPPSVQPERPHLGNQPSYVYRSRRKNFQGDQSQNSQNQNQQNNSYDPYLKMHVGMPVSKCQLHQLQVPVYEQKQKPQQNGNGLILPIQMIIVLSKAGQMIIWYKTGGQTNFSKENMKNTNQHGIQGNYLKFNFDQFDIENKQIIYTDFYLYRNQIKGITNNQYILFVSTVQQLNNKTRQNEQVQSYTQKNQNRSVKLYKYSIVMKKSQIYMQNQLYSLSLKECSPSNRFRIGQKNVKVHKKSSIASPLIPMPPLSPIFPVANNSTSKIVPSIKILNKARNLLVETTLYTLPIEEEHARELDSLQCIVHIQFGQRYILYADFLSVFAYDRITNKNVNVLCEEGTRTDSQKQGRQVAGLSFGQTDSWFVVTLLDQVKDCGVSVKVYGVNGTFLWDVDVSSIHKPIIIRQEYQSHLFLNFLVPSTLKTYHFTKSTILQKKPSLLGSTKLLSEQKKLHQSTINTLKHRLQILKTLQNYYNNDDLGSVFRLLQNCGNNGLLNDGIRFLNNLMQWESQGERTYGTNQLQLMNLANLLLQQSKYQSHIQTSLQVLLCISKSLKSSVTQNSTSNSSLTPKLWQQYTKQLRQIAGSKKLRKLQQQQKNKKIFQLAYEFVHTTNTFVLK